MRIKRKEAMKILKSCFPCDMIFDDQFVKKYTTLRELKKDDEMLVSFIFDDLFIPCNDPDNEKLLNFKGKTEIKSFENGGLNRYIPKNQLDLWYMRRGLKLVRIEK